MMRFPRSARRAALLALGALGGLACDRQTTFEPPKRVFLIVVDTLRADHLGHYGYPRATSPNLDPLARAGVVFDRAIAQWPKTGTSMAAMFTGLYPQTTGLTHKAAVRLPQRYPILPELFRDSGYTTGAVIGNAVLSAKLGWDRGFDDFIEPWNEAEVPPKTPLEWRGVLNAREITAGGERLLRKHAGAKKLFVWLHYLDPHAPYVQPDDVENHFLADEYYSPEPKIGDWFPRREILDDRHDLDYYIAQYDINVLVVDRAVRRFLNTAEELGLLEDALVVFTSDHGESLGQHDELGHGRLPYNSSLQVPLFFWYPSGIEGGRRIDRPVELIDLYPTLQEMLGVEPSGSIDGESLTPFLLPSTDPVGDDSFQHAISGSGQRGTHYRTIQSLEWKLVYHPENKRPYMPLTFELYDLEDDPGETVDLVESRADEARSLRSRLFAWMREPEQTISTSETEGHTEETVEALKALGYLN